MKTKSYYTLMGSLPYLPPFEQAAELPINPVRLQDRLRHMLDADDARRIEQAQEFVAWEKVAYHEPDEEIVAISHLPSGHPALDEIIQFRADLRTIIAALRRRHLQRPPPARGETWGTGNYPDHIVRNWDDPDFHLGHIYHWIAGVRQLLEQGQTLALEKKILGVAWNDLNRLVFGREFQLEAVLVYLFKWDIIKRWLCYSRDVARTRLQEHVERLSAEFDARLDGQQEAA